MSDKGRRGLLEGGGTVTNTLKVDGTEKRDENKDLKKGGKLGQGVSALKREAWNPLPNVWS